MNDYEFDYNVVKKIIHKGWFGMEYESRDVIYHLAKFISADSIEEAAKIYQNKVLEWKDQGYEVVLIEAKKL